MPATQVNPYHPYVHGVVEPKPLKGFPAGRVRLRLRHKSWAMAYVKTEEGVRQFLIEDHSDCWRPGFEQGRNEWSGCAIVSACSKA